MEKKKIYYWSPFLTNIATCKAVINSAYSINKFSTNYESTILDAAGEFALKEKEIESKNIFLIKLSSFNYISLLPKFGRIRSRLSFLIIFILSFFPLKKIIEKEKPSFLIIHLITSLPLLIFYLYNYKDTKLILRISGFPRMGKLRIFLWRIFLKKIFLLTCPTQATYEYLLKLNIIDNRKITVLYDPIICVSEIFKKMKDRKSVV